MPRKRPGREPRVFRLTCSSPGLNLPGLVTFLTLLAKGQGDPYRIEEPENLDEAEVAKRADRRHVLGVVNRVLAQIDVPPWVRASLRWGRYTIEGDTVIVTEKTP